MNKRQIITAIQHNQKHGARYRRPDGELGGLDRCPHPLCDKEAVRGWSCCSDHWDICREASAETRQARPESAFSTDVLLAELKRRGVIVETELERVTRVDAR